MKNLFNQIFMSILTIGFAFAIGLFSTQEVEAQRYLSEIKSSSEVKGIGQFAENLAQFLKIVDSIEVGNRLKKKLDPNLFKQLETAGSKVKAGVSSFRNNITSLRSNLHKKDQLNQALDDQINDLLKSRSVQDFYKKYGGRDILVAAEAMATKVAADIDTIIVNMNKLNALNIVNESIFLRVSFAPPSSAGKLKFKCAVLGASIFGAELLKSTKTAEIIDRFFRENCDSGGQITS